MMTATIFCEVGNGIINLDRACALKLPTLSPTYLTSLGLRGLSELASALLIFLGLRNLSAGTVVLLLDLTPKNPLSRLCL